MWPTPFSDPVVLGSVPVLEKIIICMPKTQQSRRLSLLSLGLRYYCFLLKGTASRHLKHLTFGKARSTFLGSSSTSFHLMKWFLQPPGNNTLGSVVTDQLLLKHEHQENANIDCPTLLTQTNLVRGFRGTSSRIKKTDALFHMLCLAMSTCCSQKPMCSETLLMRSLSTSSGPIHTAGEEM